MTQQPVNEAESARGFHCVSCGAKLEFEPGTRRQVCPYCDARQEIGQPDREVVEHDFGQALAALDQQAGRDEQLMIRCQACAAEFTAEPNITALECPFCGTNIVGTAQSVKQIKPQALLPFKVTRREARERFRRWIRSLWFAPGRLKQRHNLDDRIQGMYIPYWTYDSRTTTHYTGQRGEYYWETQTYTTTVNGKPRVRTRQVRRTRWYPASGTVHHFFNDVLVLASKSLPRKYTERLEPWDLANLEPYRDEFLSGFKAESYQVDLAEGFGHACQVMDDRIRRLVRQDIGGDTQRISTINTRHSDVTYKHILLPVWLSAYRYGDRVYRFLVNARTGEVQGERPWSWVKIALAVLAGAAVVAAGAWWFTQRG